MSGGNLFVLPWVSPLSNGAVVPNSKLTFSLTGTSTLSDTYTNSALTTANSNPIQADAEGTFTPIYLDPTITYRVKWTTSAGVQIKQSDDIVGGTASASYRLIAPAPSLVFQETDATPTNTRWRIAVNGETFTVDLGNDAESIWTTVITLNRNGVLRLTDPNGVYGTKQVISGESGTFVGTLTGMTTTLTGAVNYTRAGSIVTLFLGGAPILGTSNTTAMTMTGTPAAIRPANAKACACAIQDNGVASVPALAIFAPDGTITFKMISTDVYSSTGFTNSGTKGLDLEWTMSYALDSQPA